MTSPSEPLCTCGRPPEAALDHDTWCDTMSVDGWSGRLVDGGTFILGPPSDTDATNDDD